MSSHFIDYLAEILAPLGSVRSKRMFGGVGVYIGDLFCAIIVDDSLYFKGDDENEAEFAAAGCPAFTYEKDGVVHAMRYYRTPDAAMDEAEEMRRWARLGLAAALRKAAGSQAKPKRSRAAKPAKPRPTSLS